MSGFFLDLSVVGIQQVNGLVSRVQHDLKQGLRDRLKEAAKLVATEAKARTHSRRVRSAITYEVNVKSLSDYEARIGPLRRKAFFAHFLEFGTTHSRAFPFLVPSIEATEERVLDLVGTLPSLGGGRRI
jgi:HK97 gp10 family phage protein